MTNAIQLYGTFLLTVLALFHMEAELAIMILFI